MSTIHPTPFLRNVLLLDAAASGATGVLLIAGFACVSHSVEAIKTNVAGAKQLLGLHRSRAIVGV